MDEEAQVKEAVQCVGNYDLGKTLGAGKFSKVKVGTHIITGQKVAVKIIIKNQFDQKAMTKIYREIFILKLLGQLQHPNIIRLYEVIDTEKVVFLIMEYASGGEILDFIVAHGRLTEKQAKKFFRQLVSALDYCHSLKVVHRDLKCENLLLDENLNLKIIDFGLSNCFQPGALLNTHCGSPHFAAPELIQGKTYYGPEVDLWSMGVILYALVCGKLPFRGNDIRTLYHNIITCNYQSPDYLSSGCSSLIKRLLTVNPAERATMPEVRAHPWLSSKSFMNQPRDKQKLNFTSNIRFSAGSLSSSSSSLSMEPAAIVIDETLLAYMEEKLGYERAAVREALMNNVYDSATASYYLLHAKKSADTQKQAEQPPLGNANVSVSLTQLPPTTTAVLQPPPAGGKKEGKGHKRSHSHNPHTVNEMIDNTTTTAAKPTFFTNEDRVPVFKDSKQVPLPAITQSISFTGNPPNSGAPAPAPPPLPLSPSSSSTFSARNNVNIAQSQKQKRNTSDDGPQSLISPRIITTPAPNSPTPSPSPAANPPPSPKLGPFKFHKRSTSGEKSAASAEANRSPALAASSPPTINATTNSNTVINTDVLTPTTIITDKKKDNSRAKHGHRRSKSIAVDSSVAEESSAQENKGEHGMFYFESLVQSLKSALKGISSAPEGPPVYVARKQKDEVEPRTSRFAFNPNSTTQSSPSVILQDVTRILKANNIAYVAHGPYCLECKASATSAPQNSGVLEDLKSPRSSTATTAGGGGGGDFVHPSSPRSPRNRSVSDISKDPKDPKGLGSPRESSPPSSAASSPSPSSSSSTSTAATTVSSSSSSYTSPFFTKKQQSIKFEIEVCKLPGTKEIFGLRFKRLSGDVWGYKNYISMLVQLLNLQLVEDEDK